MHTQQAAFDAYPDPRKLKRYVGAEVLGLCFCVGCLVLYQLTNPQGSLLFLMWIAMGLGSLLMAALILTMTYRPLVRRPSLTVNAAGILDNCSAIFTGVGFISWSEIRGVFAYTYHAPLFGRDRPRLYLIISLEDPDDLKARVHPVINLIESFLSMTLPKGVCVPQSMLEMTLEQVIGAIGVSHPSKVLTVGGVSNQPS